MQVVNKKMCVIVILVLVIIESCTLFLMYKSYGNKNTNLDEVNLNINNSNMFAIMLEQEDGTYKEDTTSTWPTSGYKYNESMSGCIDINGNKLDGVLSYDSTNNIATVDTGNTSYCYLYFSIKPPTIGEYILLNKTNGLNAALEGGLYRFKGTDVNNYICFGTSKKNECTENLDVYMYRIIGVDENNQLKLMKQEVLKENLQWYSNSDDYVSWPDSFIYEYINDIENTNNYLKNTTYVPTGWENKIATYAWKYGYTSDLGTMNGYDSNYYYEKELAFSDIVNAKIVLPYIHDLYFSSSNNSTTLSNSWINESDIIKFTMTSGGFGSVWIYRKNTVSADSYWADSYYSVQPTFYLNLDIDYISGTGTSTDPFIIN